MGDVMMRVLMILLKVLATLGLVFLFGMCLRFLFSGLAVMVRKLRSKRDFDTVVSCVLTMGIITVLSGGAAILLVMLTLMVWR